MPRSSVKELIQGDGRLLRRTTTRELVYKNIKRFENPDKGESSSGRKPVGNKTFIIGSEGTVYHDNHDKGFFSTVLNAYAHHWTLVTKPDDWWFTILRRIAIAIDENSTKENVRNFFVDHEGRKRLEVKVKPPLDTEDFQWFFDQMADQVEKNIKRPEYVRLARPEFSTTTPDISMVANIAVMSSLQEYFEYVLSIECGIPRVDMRGSEQDWVSLVWRFQNMRIALRSIGDIVPERWWSDVEGVLDNLLATYREEEAAKEWWKEVIIELHGCGGPTFYRGWFTREFLGQHIDEAPLGIVTVPLTIDDNGYEEESAVVGGIAGFKISEEGNQTSVEANYVWGLLLWPDSYLRTTLVTN